VTFVVFGVYATRFARRAVSVIVDIRILLFMDK